MCRHLDKEKRRVMNLGQEFRETCRIKGETIIKDECSSKKWKVYIKGKRRVGVNKRK